MSIRALLAPLSLALVLPALPLAAQNEQAQDPPAFSRVFPNPSGRNGYEELVLAADLAWNCKPLAAALEPGTSLAAKRAVLDDPAAKKTLELLHVGLSKPMVSPHRDLDLSTPMPELQRFRSIARLLAIEEYVLLADGKVSAAIEAMREGLRLGYSIQKHSLISGLVGIAIDTFVLDTLAQHLDQLSVRDCDTLIALAHDWLRQPDPTPDMIAIEQAAVLNILDKGRKDPKKLLDDLGLSPEVKDQAMQMAAEMTRQDPQAIDKMAGQIAAIESARFAAMQQELRKPYYQRSPLPPPDKSIAGQALDMLGLEPAYDRALERFVMDQARIQLLAVHAAIRKYRWEHETLPTTLAQLKIGALAADPFTGQALVYKVTGATYELYAAGPFDHNAEGGQAPQRTPVYLSSTQGQPANVQN